MAHHAEESPLVSVIIPAYNAERYIRETIESALAQTYKNLEVVVGDDGSTDGTRAVVEELAARDPRVKYFSQKNAGQSAARNLAIAHARGTYVAFLDADDLFLPTKLEEQVGYLEAHPDCGACYCDINHFFDGDPEHLYHFDIPSPSGMLFEQLLRANFINPLTVVLRKELLDRYGAFEPTFRRVDEQYLWLKLSWNGAKFCHLPKALGRYRVHRTSLSNEPVYFKESEAQFLKLIEIMQRDWFRPGDAEKYHIDQLIARTKRRLMIGKLLAGNNPFSRFLMKMYYRRRMRRMVPVTVIE
jgi:glycosyltransferase involved in cell wall biosynthesis